MIDRFGQYMHKDWPGKTHSEDELAEQREREAADLAAHPGPRGLEPVRRLAGRAEAGGDRPVSRGPSGATSGGSSIRRDASSGRTGWCA